MVQYTRNCFYIPLTAATTVEEQRQSRRYAPCPAHIKKSGNE
ncbi:putative transposase domain protein [Escherichia coli DEC5D]|nr:putative transposase domain protein [Escherichia coli DEC5D]